MHRLIRCLPVLILAAIVLLLASCAAPTQAPAGEPQKETAQTEAAEAPAATEAAVETEAPVATEAPAPAYSTQAAPTQALPLPTASQAQAGAEPPSVVTRAASEGETSAPPTLIPSTPTALVPASPPPVKPTGRSDSHVVQVEWPAEMRLGDSDVVRLTLVPSDLGFTLITEYPEHQTITQTITVERPVGYELFAVGRLDGPGFEIAPPGEVVQYMPRDQSVAWRWSLTPRRSGRQRLALSLSLRWMPMPGSTALPRDLTVYSRSLDIQVHSFLGMTRPQALAAAVLSLIFGGGLAGFAIVFAPRSPARRMRMATPNASLSIETPAGLQLDPPVRTLLQALFNRYARLVIEQEFLSGYSGARTLLALPVRPDSRADAYTITKIGERSAIQREFDNYETYVKDTLPPVTARIQRPPVSTQSAGAHRLAALQYTFIGQPGQPPVSLRQELLRDPDPHWLQRLMETFGPNWWLQRRPYTFRIALEYDRLLPTHLVIEPADGKPEAGVMELDGRLPPSRLAFQPGDWVQMRRFNQAELRPDGRSYSLLGAPPPGHPRLRVRWLSTNRPEGAVGRVVSTRKTLLRRLVDGCDLFGLPDPLEALPALLDETLAGSQSTIHGDLNLENILVGPGGMLWLIDFAATRDGHTLMDFSHLAAEIVAHILAPQVGSTADYHSLLSAPAASPYAGLYALLQAAGEMAGRCLFNPADAGEYQRSLALTCLGALKYANLTPHARHLLYLTAAHTLKEIRLPIAAHINAAVQRK